jgi:hypothetical protein
LRLGLQPLALLVPILLLITACGSSHEQAASQPVVWAGLPDSGAGGQSVVRRFNAYLEQRTGPASPTELALVFIRADRTQAARTTTEAQAAPEGGGPTTVTVIQDGLADDSVRAARHILHFVPAGESWRLDSAARTQRCHPGRGHQDFSASACV